MTPIMRITLKVPRQPPETPCPKLSEEETGDAAPEELGMTLSP